MKKSKLQIVVVVVYVLILGHFLVSNFFQVLGPHYTLKTAAYKHNLAALQKSEEEDPPNNLCGSSNVDLNVQDPPQLVCGPAMVPARIKGFPIAANGEDDFDTPLQAQDFTEAKPLNFAYIGILTVAFGGYYVWLRKHQR